MQRAAIAVLAAALWLAALPAFGADPIGPDKKIGAGVGVGQTASLTVTGKYYVLPQVGVQVFGGLRGQRDTALSADVVWEPLTLYAVPGGRIFAGVGGGLTYSTSAGSSVLGIEAVVEAGVRFEGWPVELVLDWRPYTEVGRDGYYAGSIAGAGRWYF